MATRRRTRIVAVAAAAALVAGGAVAATPWASADDEGDPPPCTIEAWEPVGITGPYLEASIRVHCEVETVIAPTVVVYQITPEGQTRTLSEESFGTITGTDTGVLSAPIRCWEGAPRQYQTHAYADLNNGAAWAITDSPFVAVTC